MRQGIPTVKWRRLAAVAAVLTTAAPAYAQRAAENVINAAEDAFGTSVGNETIGLYSANSARGFNPAQAGNNRVAGLYFDEYGIILGPNRIYSGTIMRVGLSAQSYPFPAPTGIVDNRLRRAGDRFAGSAALTYGPYDSLQADVETSGPLVPGRLSGLASLSAFDTKTDSQTNYEMLVYGGSLNWTPSDDTDVVMFARGQVAHSTTAQTYVFTAGGAMPPEYDRSVYFGQSWALRHRDISHLGVVASTALPAGWLFRAAFFRAYQSYPYDFLLFFRNVQPDGVGAFDILRTAPGKDLSYSGEARLTRSFTEGSRRHTINLAVRGRDSDHLFGGGSSVPIGPARIGMYNPVPEPVFPPAAPPGQTHISQITPGLSAVSLWPGVGELSVGAQKSFFSSEVTLPGLTPARTESRPWIYNGTLAANLGEDVVLYGSYTRGVEESGIAPENASNRGEVAPASLTEQVDAGIRYRLGVGFTLIAGVFELKKPYFDRNSANLFTQVGRLTHRGVELSVAGQPLPGLTVVAGAMLLRARIVASAAVANFIAPIPVGRPNRSIRFNVQYGPDSWGGLSVDGQLNHDGPAYANRANTVRLDARTTLDLGLRYGFRIFDRPALLRLRLRNVTNAYGWTVAASGAYSPTPARNFMAQLTTDF